MSKGVGRITGKPKNDRVLQRRESEPAPRICVSLARGDFEGSVFLTHESVRNQLVVVHAGDPDLILAWHEGDLWRQKK